MIWGSEQDMSGEASGHAEDGDKSYVSQVADNKLCAGYVHQRQQPHTY